VEAMVTETLVGDEDLVGLRGERDVK